MGFSSEFKEPVGLEAFFGKLSSPAIRQAGARGLNEHVEEQRRQSVVGISAYTGIPKARVGRVMRVLKASASASNMQAKIIAQDKAIGLAEYGEPFWHRSMPGAVATGWNVRRVFPGAFFAKGKVMVRQSKDRNDLKTLSAAVLPNELSKPSRPNVAKAQRFASLDLEKRVTRHVMRAIGVS